MNDMRRLRYTLIERGAWFSRLLYCDRRGSHRWHEPDTEEWRICRLCGQSEVLDWADLHDRLIAGEPIPLSYNMTLKALSYSRDALERLGRAVAS